MKLKAPEGVGDPCVAGVVLATARRPLRGRGRDRRAADRMLRLCRGRRARKAERCARAAAQPPGRQKIIAGGLTMAASDLAALADVKTWLVGLERHRLVRRRPDRAPDHRCQRRDHRLSRPAVADAARLHRAPRRRRQGAAVSAPLSGAASHFAGHRQSRGGRGGRAGRRCAMRRTVICSNPGTVCRRGGRNRSIYSVRFFAKAGRTSLSVTMPVTPWRARPRACPPRPVHIM